MSDDPRIEKVRRIGAHHDFGPASGGEITCSACGRSYDTENAWMADIEPCGDRAGLDITVAEAKAHYSEVLRDLFGLPWIPE